jgi:phenylacetate-coenzyme A ligase PaaK-like adenylate-forming protein
MPAKSLQALVTYVRKNSPFYAELYRDVPEHISHITQLPIVDQIEFWAANTWHNNRLLTGPVTDGAVYKTGGTTGRPKLSPWTRSEHYDSVRAFGAGIAQAGLKPGHRVANLFRAGELYAGFLYIEHALLNAPVENVRLALSGTAPDEYVADLISHLDINVLCGEPMRLSAIAEFIVRRGQTADSVELLLSGGDILFSDLRPILTRAFPKAAMASVGYASVDAGLVGTPIPGDDVRVHEPFRNATLVEILDEVTDEPITTLGVPGRVVVTNLFRTLMPIIRYPVGDRAEWVDLERQRFRLVGRTTEGARVGMIAMPTEDVREVLLAADPGQFITGMQMVQRRWDNKDGLIIRLARIEEPPAELTQQLIDAVYKARPLYPDEVKEGRAHPLQIEWVSRSELVTNPLTGKLRQVVDERQHTAEQQ